MPDWSEPPAHLPPALKAWLTKQKKHVSTLSIDMGYADNFVSNLFKGDQHHFQTYCRIADAGSISVQLLVEKIQNRQMKAYIDLLVSKLDVVDEKDRHRKGLAKKIGVGETTLRRLCKDEARLNGIHSYVALAEFTGIPIDALRKPSAFTTISA